MIASDIGAIRVGVGGWIYPPWRGTFYPHTLPRTRELAFATRRLATLEISATFYGTQRATTFRSWARTAPEGFVFAVKGPRAATHRGDLAEARPVIDRFVQGGLLELGDRLGPVLWQLPEATPFDPDQFARFLALLPPQAGSQPLRHAVEVRHESFRHPLAVRLMRDHGVALAIIDSERTAPWEDVTAGFVYVRMQRCSNGEAQGYAPLALEQWADRLRAWSAGRIPPRTSLLTAPTPPVPRQVYAYFVGGFKQRCPTAALALLHRLGEAAPASFAVPAREGAVRVMHG